MGLKYNAQDSQRFISALKNNLFQCRQVIAQIKSGTKHLISSLGDGTNLSGAAYNAGQGLFTEVMYPTTEQFDRALDDLDSDISRYLSAEDSVSSYGDLDEDDLKEQHKQKQEQKELLENQQTYYMDLAYSNPSLYDAMMAAARNLQQMIDEIERQIQELEKQLTALQEFEYQTSPLFKDSLDAFGKIVQGISAISAIVTDASGNYSTSGLDMSWLTKLKQEKFDSKTGADKSLEEAVSELGLSDETLAYWKKEMKSELKNIPKSQWNDKIKEAAANLKFDKDGNILQIGPFQQGVIVLKNGIYDEALTDRANKEYDAENWERAKESFGQLLAGGASMIGGALLDLGGVAVMTGGSGLTLTGAGAAVGVPLLSGAVSMEGVGTAAVIAGSATVGSALSKINVPV
ncbi:hypothetical protein, partial [Lactovum odontotermitis]